MFVLTFWREVDLFWVIISLRSGLYFLWSFFLKSITLFTHTVYYNTSTPILSVAQCGEAVLLMPSPVCLIGYCMLIRLV
jgi:hypothetical protein